MSVTRVISSCDSIVKFGFDVFWTGSSSCSLATLKKSRLSCRLVPHVNHCRFTLCVLDISPSQYFTFNIFFDFLSISRLYSFALFFHAPYVSCSLNISRFDDFTLHVSLLQYFTLYLSRSRCNGSFTWCTCIRTRAQIPVLHRNRE